MSGYVCVYLSPSPPDLVSFGPLGLWGPSTEDILHTNLPNLLMLTSPTQLPSPPKTLPLTFEKEYDIKEISTDFQRISD